MAPPRLLLAAAFAVALAPARAAGAGGHAVVLQYHHFGDDTPPSTSVTLPRFTAHLDYLEAEGFTLWPLEKIVEVLGRGKPLPEKCAAITIDDALSSVHSRAFPLLKARGIPFTVFVATESIDRGFRGYMSWEQMREMAAHGASFASHGHGHGYLVRRREGESEGEWSSRVRADIEVSLRRLREEIGPPPPLFAYPYGEYSGPLRRIVRDLGLVGVAQKSGPLYAGSDFGALPRFPMAAAFAEMDSFAEKVRSLPLPVLSADPDDPLLPPGETLPRLRLRIGPGEYARESLACYGGGQGRIEALWTDRREGLVEVAAKKPLPPGRSLYTCTARHLRESRYFWYSHLWIRPGGE